jgi:hypothetical protein
MSILFIFEGKHRMMDATTLLTGKKILLNQKKTSFKCLIPSAHILVGILQFYRRP